MNKDEESLKTKDIQNETLRTQARLFSRKEVEDIVKELVRAYIRGQVTLSLALSIYRIVTDHYFNLAYNPDQDYYKS